MLEVVNYLEDGFGYAFMLSSLAENLIKIRELKKVTIKISLTILLKDMYSCLYLFFAFIHFNNFK